MKRSTNTLALLCAATVISYASACAGGNDAATDSAATATPPASATAAVDSAAVRMGGTPGALLDPNSATRDQLMALPGMTAGSADSIVARRPFQTMLGVDSILARTMSEAQRDSIYARLFKPLDLNTASKQEILLIPGVGDRMHHEFEEYRPYDNIAKFRREMAKYVGDTTIARYEKYVTIR